MVFQEIVENCLEFPVATIAEAAAME